MANVTGPEGFASKFRDNIRVTPLFGQIQYMFIPLRLLAARLASKRVANFRVFYVTCRDGLIHRQWRSSLKPGQITKSSYGIKG